MNAEQVAARLRELYPDAEVELIRTGRLQCLDCPEMKTNRVCLECLKDLVSAGAISWETAELRISWPVVIPECDGCGVHDESVTRRACGQVLCSDCHREHLDHEPSVGLVGCMACGSDRFMRQVGEYADWRE